MGNFLSSSNRPRVDVFLCHGNRHKNNIIKIPKKVNNNNNTTITIDLNEKVEPDIVGDITTTTIPLPNNIETLTFAFCPTYLFNHDVMCRWFNKVRIGGKIIIFGPSYDSTINVKKAGQKGALQLVSFKKILLKQIKKSGTTYEKKLNPTQQPHIILIRKK